MAFFRLVPNLNIMAPKDFKELEQMLEFAVNLNKPVVIRYPRGGEDSEKIEKHEKIELGKAEILQEGENLSIIAIGKMVPKAIKLAKEIQKKWDEEQEKITLKDKENRNGIQTKKTIEVINARFLKPLDKETIKKSIEKTKSVITIEDGIIINGLATAIKELIVDEKIEGVTLKTYAYPDKFIEHGNVEELENKYLWKN